MVDNFSMVISGTLVIPNKKDLYWKYSSEYDDLCIRFEDLPEFWDEAQEFSISIPRKKGTINIDFLANEQGVIFDVVIPNLTQGKDLTLLEFKQELNAIFNQKKYANVIQLLGMNIAQIQEIEQTIASNYDVNFEGEGND